MDKQLLFTSCFWKYYVYQDILSAGNRLQLTVLYYIYEVLMSINKKLWQF